MKKPFIGICRVSSDEQEERGFSLDVQEERIRAFAARMGLVIREIHRIAESAADAAKRPKFQAILNAARKEARDLGGIIWCSVDRAARNPQDQLEIMELPTKYGLSIEFIDGTCDPSTAIGEYFLNLQAAQARYMVRNLSESTKRSVKRRVDQGLFVGRAPFGYRNVRVNGRAFAVVDEENAEKVRRIFELYAFADHTLDSLVDALWEEGLRYTTKQPQFKRKHLHDILGDRAYIGDVTYKGEWFPGVHETIIERTTFRRVQVRLGGRTYMKHSLTFSHGLLLCGHCGRQITGESKLKALASGETREYVYYRCARYKSPGHPSGARVREQDLDEQLLDLFDRLRVDDREVREWFAEALRARMRASQAIVTTRLDKLQTRLTRVRHMRDELLNGRLAGEIEQDVYAAKGTELRDEEARLKELIDTIDERSSDEGDLIAETFGLSQRLREQWLAADQPAKRRILNILSSDWTLEGGILTPVLRKPFDVLARGLVGAMGEDGDPMGI